MRRVAINRAEIDRVLGPMDRWYHQCHQASLAIVKSGVQPGSRVARGTCRGVMGQHSWVVLGNPYDPKVQIIDPTLWSYLPGIEGVWYGSASQGWHVPHGGLGSIWEYGQPVHAGGETIILTPTFELSAAARDFLALIEPLDRRGWETLIHAPIEGWPASEIIAAIDDTDELKATVPIDILGMVTNRNPGGLYLG